MPAGTGRRDGASVYLTNGAEVYGAIIGKIAGYNSNVRLHFDEPLTGVDALSKGEDSDEVGDLHVSVRPVEVT